MPMLVVVHASINVIILIISFMEDEPQVGSS